MKKHFLITYIIFTYFICAASSQHILPTPLSIKPNEDVFIVPEKLIISSDQGGTKASAYLFDRLSGSVDVTLRKNGKGNIVLRTENAPKDLGKEGYVLEVTKGGINIVAQEDAGLFYGVQSLLQLLPPEVQAGKSFLIAGCQLAGLRIVDKPKYSWRSFMMDSGRQYQSPEFIKRYLDYMAMLKMNVFHWHLTEGQGWRIEIKKYPRLTGIGSKVAQGEQQQGYYTQEQIREIVAYAEKLHILVMPEIDVPGHSEAALTAYPEMTCKKKAPKSVMSFSPALFCGGSEDTYKFLEGVLEEVCELFPSSYIHLGGDEAPKNHWNQCTNCQNRILSENLANTHDLQLYFSTRLATYLKTKGKKAVFWGDVVYHEGTLLPNNVVVQWWNWLGHKDKAMQNAIKRGHQVIANTNYYTYLNFPLIPWSKYNEKRTFDLRDIYEHNPADLNSPHELVLGMGCSLWTDWYVKEDMIDQRVFPRVYALAEQMWSKAERKPFDQFYRQVKSKYLVLEALGIDFGPAIREEVKKGYKWD